MRAIGCDHGGRYGSLIGGVHAPAPAMGKAAKAHQRCDIHIPVNIGSLGEQPDHSRPLPPVKHGEGATPQLYLPAIGGPQPRSEEHTSELQSLMRISYAVFCLTKQKKKYCTKSHTQQTAHP